MSIKTDLNPQQPSKLEQKVMDIIYENVPINNYCPHCERGIDISCLLTDPSKNPSDYRSLGEKRDDESWVSIARQIIDAVKEHIQLALREEA